MAFDLHANLLKVTVTVAPSPATTGTTISIANTDRTILLAALPTTPYNLVAGPATARTETNVEIIKVTAVGAADSGGTGNTQLTITRQTEAIALTSTARTILVGDTLTANITAKTITDIERNASSDGWISSSDTFTYASATSFTIAGVDRTLVYTKGTRIKFTNNGVTYYGTVYSSSFSTNTTVTLFTNTDFTIANSAITSPSYSYQASPQGYPTNFTINATSKLSVVGAQATVFGYLAIYTAAASSGIAATITWGLTFASIPIVACAYAGGTGGNVSTISAYSVTGGVFAAIDNLSTTTGRGVVQSGDATTRVGANTTNFITWIVTGAF